ncbi:ankyrin repeat domain-containing protein [Chryseobacterium gregarium]|uniref:ankyrin repeat domain-containing protein n=1 Tax=Chryseobacterium gregarium TaxID=456299 RepID=UPI00041B6A41|nr:ankyrin repeat domain-containing protein [Chryseobacterium gregarium]
MITNRETRIQFIPDKHQRSLLSAIANGDLDQIKKIIGQNGIDANVYDHRTFSPIMMEALTSFGIKDEDDRLKILRFFLDHGADPNLNCKSGYNALHIAVQQERLVRALDLFLDFGGDVNSADQNGATVAYWAIQGFPWKAEGELRQKHLNVVEKIMMLGADLGRKNKFGVAPRDWLERSPEDLRQLVRKCEKLNPRYQESSTIQPDFPTHYTYPDIVKYIRTHLIPVRGEAETLEGEMLRGLDILQDEAYRNGNANYSKTHKDFAAFILDNLTTFTKTGSDDIEKITEAVKKLMNPEKPYLEDDVYDYLTDQICLFHLKINNDEFETVNKKWWKFWL